MRALLIPLALASCTEFPALDARIPAAERDAPPPPLVPLTGILAAADATARAPAFEADLRAGAADLAARAAALPVPEADQAIASRAADLTARAGTVVAPGPLGDEADRLAALAARAEALRVGVLTEEERTRLEGGPSLP